MITMRVIYLLLRHSTNPSQYHIWYVCFEVKTLAGVKVLILAPKSHRWHLFYVAKLNEKLLYDSKICKYLNLPKSLYLRNKSLNWSMSSHYIIINWFFYVYTIVYYSSIIPVIDGQYYVFITLISVDFQFSLSLKNDYENKPVFFITRVMPMTFLNLFGFIY